MTIVLDGTTGITNDGGYTGDGVVFADTTPANTLVTTTGGSLLVGATSAVYASEKLSVVNTANNSTPAIGFSAYSRGIGAIIRAASGTYAEFFCAGTSVQTGAITTNGSTTAYNTSSDYRLKENVQPITGALATVAALKPVTYRWKSTGEDDQGFIAHELQEVMPGAVTGEKDAVDAEGKPVYQGIDTSFLVATLTAAIQEQQQLITALTARVAALEGTQP